MPVVSWAGVAVMALAAAFFAAQFRTTAPPKFVAGALVAAVAVALAYAWTALWPGDTVVHYAASFVAVAVATAQLAWLADADATPLGAAVVATGLMFAAAYAGLRGLIEPTLALFVAAAVFGVAALAVLFTRVSPFAGRQPDEVATLFSVLRNLAVPVWLGYPFVWLFGLGLTLLPGAALTVAYLVVDVIAVVGINGLLLRNAEALERA